MAVATHEAVPARESAQALATAAHAPVARSRGAAEGVLALQRAAGNRVVNAALGVARCPGRCSCGGREGDDEMLDETQRHLGHAALARRAAASPTRARRRAVQRQPSHSPTMSACQIRFHVNTTRVISTQERDACLDQARAYVTAGGQRSVTVHGYASEEGDPQRNRDLAQARAEAMRDLLVRRGVSASVLTPQGHGADTTYPDRPANRRVEIALAEQIDFPGETIEVPRTKCGPDVTQQVSDAITLTRTSFAGWSADQKDEACEELRSVQHGGIAWDIVDLHNNAWILNYRPMCATQGAAPPCGSTVEVADQCYYAGSANYVIFGTMCRLCYDHFYAQGRAGANVGYTGYMDFTEDSMVDLIDLYKSSSANVGPSKAWAIAGRDGWPNGGSPPRGDRSGCAPDCIEPYNGPAFRVNWYPRMWHTGEVDR